MLYWCILRCLCERHISQLDQETVGRKLNMQLPAELYALVKSALILS